jgi:outer membrane protein TolC
VTPPAKNSNPIVQSRREAIAREEAHLDQLDAARADVRNDLAALRSELASLDDAPHPPADLQHPPVSGVPETPTDKIRLFRSLFRGRSARGLQTP